MIVVVVVVVGPTLGFVVSVRKCHGLFFAVTIYRKISKKQTNQKHLENVTFFKIENHGNNICLFIFFLKKLRDRINARSLV